MPHHDQRRTVLTVFGTRPEVIKLAPVIRALALQPSLRSLVVFSGQHADLVPPLVALFDLQVDHQLQVLQPGQTLNDLAAGLLTTLEELLNAIRPDLVLVQGDTTTALAAALAAFHHQMPVAHVEAGMRSGDPNSPFPEEMNRQLIARLATYHFAATPGNRANLLAEGVLPERVFLTGNPVVDAMHLVLGSHIASPELARILAATSAFKRLVLTTHRRESFGATLAANLQVLRAFVLRHDDVVLLFPVHPNPCVRAPAEAILGGQPRVHLLAPLEYGDFLTLLARAWLIVSDSGGIQEEAPSLGVPLLVLRNNTERPEAIECGSARLAGTDPSLLHALLEEAHRAHGDGGRSQRIENPFGHGDSAQRIVAALLQVLDAFPPPARQE